MNNSFNIAPLDQLLHAFLSSVDEASGELLKIRQLGIKKVTRDGKPLLPPLPISEKLVDQVFNSLIADSYLEVVQVRTDPIANVYRLTAFGKETLRILNYRISQIKANKGFVPVEMKQLQAMFRENEIVLLPLSTDFSISSAYASSCYSLLVCPYYYDKEAIVEIKIPRMNAQYAGLLRGDPEHDIFIAFALMLTLKGVEVFIPAVNKEQTAPVDPDALTEIQLRDRNNYPMVLELFDPIFQPIDIPMIHLSDIEPLLSQRETIEE